jgi:hypothetical protein
MMAPMSRTLVLVLLAVVAAGCTVPTGAEVETCGAEWRGLDAMIVEPTDAAGEPVEIDCMRQVDERRIRIGFTMPGGPSCYRLVDYAVQESADAVSVALFIAAVDDPAAGACAPEARQVTTDIDLQAPVDDRRLLDANGEG